MAAIVETRRSTRKRRRRREVAVDRLSDLEVFAAVVAEGSFTAAARALGVSKSHVSRQIQRLEDRLGARLLHRTTRRLNLTDVGTAFHGRARRILAELDEAEQAVRDLQTEPRGTLRLGAPTSFGVRYISPVIASFMARWPELRVEVSFSDRRVDVVAEGLDAVVRIGPLADSSLIVRRLATTRPHIVASPAYLERRGTPTHPSELAEHACLRYAHQVSGQAWTLRRNDGTEMAVRVDGPLLADNGDALLDAARHGLGLAYMPDFFLVDDLASGRLVPVLDGWTDHASPVSILYPHGRHLSAKVRLFVDHLRTRLAEHPWCPDGPG